ncbi:MAG: hypothetical protein ABGX10_15180 [Paracoccus sp. (in: a-proteobacteria)]|uniref:hypothetical protein n=1 Tax=Paracoccus sp. TaxID=267 RepID=UPI003241BDA7
MTPTTQHSPIRQYDANGSAASIAADLERGALGIDTAFHATQAFGALDRAAYSGPISTPSADRLTRALDGIRPHLLALGDGLEHHVFALAALEGVRMRVDVWNNWGRLSFPDKSGLTAAALARWLAKSCDMAWCFLGFKGKEKFPSGAELPGMNV